MNPLTASAATKKPLLPLEKVKAIFSIIEVIYNYNSMLLEGIESRMKRWIADEKKTPLCLGDIFAKMVRLLRLFWRIVCINYLNYRLTTWRATVPTLTTSTLPWRLSLLPRKILFSPNSCEYVALKILRPSLTFSSES